MRLAKEKSESSLPPMALISNEPINASPIRDETSGRGVHVGVAEKMDFNWSLYEDIHTTQTSKTTTKDRSK
jgi:hypothetical protein